MKIININKSGFSYTEVLIMTLIIFIVAIIGVKIITATHAQSSGGGPGGSAFLDPFRGVSGLDPWRIDEGVDFRGDGPVYAVGPGIVTDVRIASHGFSGCTSECESHFWANDGGNDVIYKITAGKASGEYIYVAEDCIPTTHIGAVVSYTSEICRMYGPDAYTAGYYGIETGEWNGPIDNGTSSSKPLAYIHGQYSVDGTETHYGYNMNLRLVSLGDPPGNTTTKHPHIPPYVSNNPGQVSGAVPTGWPNTWE